ncbi:hypothetical protein [Variovorax arabinosiphilus]|uniref:hypothetical protein n=1 Tax=Variovorax arabinosiphilus TaxID=3053498 RepID=UPI0025757470|nr:MULTISPECIES: hypothetical protein [unclassified Variovorax]MDM0119005.1 hypothetical protein [Variovorax sp. J2L1-78]MDM0129431.1 hypothetical protein [Variovorax sp. J2L1-63]MDM0232783.1 hypothetical protein [Variovorax sp. J2R1-6]
MSLATAVKVGIEIVNAVRQSEADRSFASWQRGISSKLRSIYENTEEILEDLKLLRIDIRDIVVEDSRRDFIAALEGATFDLLAIGAGLGKAADLTDHQRSRVLASCGALRTVLGAADFGRFGATTVPWVLPSYVALRAALSLAGADENEIDTTEDTMVLKYFDPAIDPSNVNSLLYAARLAEDEITRLRPAISSRMRDATLGFTTAMCSGAAREEHRKKYHPYVPNCFQVWQWICTFTGDPDRADSVESLGDVSTRHSGPTPQPMLGVLYMFADPPLVDTNARPRNGAEVMALRTAWVDKLNLWTRQIAKEKEKALELRGWAAAVKDALFRQSINTLFSHSPVEVAIAAHSPDNKT